MGRVRVSVLAALTMLVSLVTPAAAAAGNSSPTVPTGLSVGGCVFVCASPTRTAGIVTKDRTPLLTARSTDVDRNPMRYRFQLVKGTVTVSDVTTAPLASGALGRFQVTQGLADGSDYRYRVVATDGVRAGAWSGWIGFAVDTVAPLAPKVKVVSKVSTSVDSFSGSIGESPVDVTLSEQTGGDRVWGYAWDVLPQNWTPAAPATLRCGTVRSACVGSVNADLKVPTFTVPDSISTFTAWAFDAAGNARSVASTVRLQAFASRRPTLGHQWRTQGAAPGCSARLLADGATSDKRSLTVSSGVCRTRPEAVMPGQSVSVLRFTGSSGSADTAGQPMVDVTDNFTVAAWARPTALGTQQTVLSQDGPHRSGFELGLNADDEWQFCVTVTSGPPACVTYPGSTGRGSWLFVAGSYNRSSKSLKLAVSDDGSAYTSVRSPVAGTVAAATGGLQIGRASVAGQAAHRWHGDVFLPSVLPGIANDRQITQVGRDWDAPVALCRIGCGS